VRYHQSSGSPAHLALYVTARGDPETVRSERDVGRDFGSIRNTGLATLSEVPSKDVQPGAQEFETVCELRGERFVIYIQGELLALGIFISFLYHSEGFLWNPTCWPVLDVASSAILYGTAGTFIPR
jgi:hypothetical protein